MAKSKQKTNKKRKYINTVKVLVTQQNEHTLNTYGNVDVTDINNESIKNSILGNKRFRNKNDAILNIEVLENDVVEGSQDFAWIDLCNYPDIIKALTEVDLTLKEADVPPNKLRNTIIDKLEKQLATSKQTTRNLSKLLRGLKKNI